MTTRRQRWQRLLTHRRGIRGRAARLAASAFASGGAYRLQHPTSSVGLGDGSNRGREERLLSERCPLAATGVQKPSCVRDPRFSDEAARALLLEVKVKDRVQSNPEGEALCRLVGRVRVARAPVKTLASAAPSPPFPFPFLPRRCSLAGEDQAGPAVAELLLLLRQRLCRRSRISDLPRACVGSVGVVGTRSRWEGPPDPTGAGFGEASSGRPCSLGRLPTAERAPALAHCLAV